MSYTKQTSPEIPGETVVKLGSGELAAISCKIERATNTQNRVYCVTARWIDESGETKRDGDGEAVKVFYRHNSPPEEFNEQGATLVHDCLMIALGEDTTALAVSEHEKHHCSICAAIGSAQATLTPVDVGSVL